MVTFDLDFQNCTQDMRDKCLYKLFDLLYVISETWSKEDDISMEDEFQDILFSLLYKYLCFINARASGDVCKKLSSIFPDDKLVDFSSNVRLLYDVLTECDND